jgi:hypothetical protein
MSTSITTKEVGLGLVWRGHTLSVKCREDLVSLASMTCESVTTSRTANIIESQPYPTHYYGKWELGNVSGHALLHEEGACEYIIG